MKEEIISFLSILTPTERYIVIVFAVVILSAVIGTMIKLILSGKMTLNTPFGKINEKLNSEEMKNTLDKEVKLNEKNVKPVKRNILQKAIQTVGEIEDSSNLTQEEIDSIVIDYNSKIAQLEKSNEKLKNELLMKDSVIEELNNKITEFSIDKTEDYFVFENHLLKEFAINTKQYLISESSRFIKPDKTKSIFNLSDYEFDQYLKKSMKNLIENFNDNILDIYNGSIVKKIDSFYQIINWSKNSKVFATEYKRLFVNFKNLALTHSNQKKIKLNELDDIIMNEFIAMKVLLKEKLNEVEGDLNFTDIEKINYMLDRKEFYNTIFIISEYYLNLNNELKDALENQYDEMIQLFIAFVMKLMTIKFMEILIDNINENNEIKSNFEKYLHKNNHVESNDLDKL